MEPKKIFIKPAKPSMVVRHPENLKKIIKQEGEWVTNNRDWQRELLQGSIVLATPPKEKVKEEKQVHKDKPVDAHAPMQKDKGENK